MYRGPMNTGKDRQTAIEYPAPIPVPSYPLGLQPVPMPTPAVALRW